MERQAVRHGVGRPRHVYDVTDAAQDLFPTNYDGLASGLLAAIKSIGGEALIDDVFEERRRLTRDRFRQRLAERLPAGAPLIDRARELAVIQDEQGYLAEARSAPTASSGWSSATARSAASRRSTPPPARPSSTSSASCSTPDVQRETHIAAGDRCCTYRIGSPTD